MQWKITKQPKIISKCTASKNASMESATKYFLMKLLLQKYGVKSPVSPQP